MPLLSQQTIFDVPSADVAPRGDWFYQHQTVARSWGGDRRWVQSNAFGLGVGHAVELNATLYNVDLDEPCKAPLAVGFKWSPTLVAEPVTLRFVAGQMVTVRRATPKAGYWTYFMLSAETRTHTRITGGYTAGTTLFGRHTSSPLMGIEQRLSERWMLQADWYSGRHDLSYLIPGAVYRFSKNWMISAGYQFPNPHTDGFRAIVIELTRAPH